MNMVDFLKFDSAGVFLRSLSTQGLKNKGIKSELVARLVQEKAGEFHGKSFQLFMVDSWPAILACGKEDREEAARLCARFELGEFSHLELNQVLKVLRFCRCKPSAFKDLKEIRNPLHDGTQIHQEKVWDLMVTSGEHFLLNAISPPKWAPAGPEQQPKAWQGRVPNRPNLNSI
jgi:hypothetical protein